MTPDELQAIISKQPTSALDYERVEWAREQLRRGLHHHLPRRLMTPSEKVEHNRLRNRRRWRAEGGA